MVTYWARFTDRYLYKCAVDWNLKLTKSNRYTKVNMDFVNSVRDLEWKNDCVQRNSKCVFSSYFEGKVVQICTNM